MVALREVAEKVYLFETPVPGIERVLSVYIIGEERGILLEPGPASAIPAVLEGMRQLGLKELSGILPTHIHLDHAGAVGELTALFPHSKVMLHPSAVRHAVNPSRLIQGTRMAFGEDFEKSWGAILPVPESQIRTPADGEELSLDGREIRVIYTPGHAPHHIAFLDIKTGGLFCGEALGVPKHGAESFPLPAVAPPSFDMDTYLETMEKLRAIKPRTLFYSHDGVGREPEKLIPVAIENTRIFGDIILRALKDGKSTQEIGHVVHEYIFSRTGASAEEADRTMTVDAYRLYFKKKGLV